MNANKKGPNDVGPTFSDLDLVEFEPAPVQGNDGVFAITTGIIAAGLTLAAGCKPSGALLAGFVSAWLYYEAVKAKI